MDFITFIYLIQSIAMDLLIVRHHITLIFFLTESLFTILLLLCWNHNRTLMNILIMEP